VKVTLFRGGDLDPKPPGTFKQPGVRALDIYEADELDVVTMTRWMEQASRLPGERL
jgi:hypothetical protein